MKPFCKQEDGFFGGSYTDREVLELGTGICIKG